MNTKSILAALQKKPSVFACAYHAANQNDLYAVMNIVNNTLLARDARKIALVTVVDWAEAILEANRMTPEVVAKIHTEAGAELTTERAKFLSQTLLALKLHPQGDCPRQVCEQWAAETAEECA